MQNLLFRRYMRVMKHAAGGTLDVNGVGPYTELGALGSGVIDSISKPNQYGYQSSGATIGKSILSDVGTGAAFGSAIPGVGTALGAGVGATVGLVQGLLKSKSNNAHEHDMMNAASINQRQQEIQRSNAILANDPSLATGSNNSYFKDGGSLFQRYVLGGGLTGDWAPAKYGKDLTANPRTPLNDLITSGGDAKKLSSENALIQGNSHAEGGIQIPELNAEVEGGETTLGEFVFSKKLGYADQHKPIAIAKGKIEKKPQTLERANSMRLLRDKEQRLATEQETIKKYLNIQ